MTTSAPYNQKLTWKDGNQAKSLLFMDFDNFYHNLRRADEQLAETFARFPHRLVDFLTSGGDSSGPTRRFLVKKVYADFHSFRRYESSFVGQGFDTVSVPTQTQRGKNSADISLALDVMDAVYSGLPYEEFVIISSDADFTPVLRRLRAHDRRTVVVSAGPVSSSLRSICDFYIGLPEIAEALSPSSVEDMSDRDRVSNSRKTQDATLYEMDLLRERILGFVRTSPRPVTAASVAEMIQVLSPALRGSDWVGEGSFRGFLLRYVPELQLIPSPAPGYVLDPHLHSLSDLGSYTGESVDTSRSIELVAQLSGMPRLTSEEFGALFKALDADMKRYGFEMSSTSKRVRDTLASQGYRVGREAINTVLRVLARSDSAGTSATDLANTIADVVVLDRGLRDSDALAVRRWITSASGENPSPRN